MLESGHYSAMRHGFGCFRSFGSSGPNRGTHGAGQRPYGLLAFGHAVQIAHDVRIADMDALHSAFENQKPGYEFSTSKPVLTDR